MGVTQLPLHSHPLLQVFSMNAQLNLRNNALATFRNESNSGSATNSPRLDRNGPWKPIEIPKHQTSESREHAYGGSHSTSSSSVSFLSVQFMENWVMLQCSFLLHPRLLSFDHRLMEFEMFHYHRVSIWSMIGREEFYFIPTSELLILTKSQSPLIDKVKMAHYFINSWITPLEIFQSDKSY